MRRLLFLASTLIYAIQAFEDFPFSVEPILIVRSDPFSPINLQARSGGSGQPRAGSGQGSPSRRRTDSHGPAQGQGQTPGREQIIAQESAQRQAQRRAQREAQIQAQPTAQEQAQALSRAFTQTQAQRDSDARARAHILELGRSRQRGQARGQGQIQALTSALQSHSNPRYREVGNELAPQVTSVRTNHQQLMSRIAQTHRHAQLATHIPEGIIKHLQDVQAGRKPNRENLSPEEISRRMREMQGYIDSFARYQEDMTDMHQELSETAQQYETGQGSETGPAPRPGSGRGSNRN